MIESQISTGIDFHTLPPVGPEDWRYAYATAVVRCLEANLLTRAQYQDMANAGRFEDALETLNNTEYAPGETVSSFAKIEELLLSRREAVRNLYIDLAVDEKQVELLRAREDFKNMRLAIRRVVTEREIGHDYSQWGAVDADEFGEIFETENYERLPEYLQDAVENAVLGYYENRDIRRIDYEIDRVQAQYRLEAAMKQGSVFLSSLFRLRTDLYNIRTMLRLKMGDEVRRDLFFDNGFVETGKFIEGLDMGMESVASLFFATPYHAVVEKGADYLRREESFIGLERECEDYELAFLKSAMSISAGPQPVLAYCLMKEHEIRTVRLVLGGKYNQLETKLILDRLPESF